MKNYIILVLALLTMPVLSFAGGMEDDPLLATLIIDKLEMHSADGSNPLVWDAEGWIGKDLNKFWFKTEGELAKKGQVLTMFSS